MFKGLFKAGETVYFYSPTDSWIIGTVENVDEKNKKGAYSVRPSSLNKDPIVNDDQLLQFKNEIAHLDHNDLLQMTELHEVTLMECLKNRYKKDVIYTLIGGVLAVAMNPFKWTIPYVQDDMMDKYMKQDSKSSDNLLPHAWTIADNAYRFMRETGQNQSILISGESGAGKTEGCKTVIKYLSKLSCSITHDEKSRLAASQIATKIQESSPILEAFGNSKTQRNDNSSRFGKFIVMQFDKEGIIMGAYIHNYLLEKSRVISSPLGERGYHIFYQMIAGLDDKTKKDLFLTKPEDFVCLSSGKCFKVDGVDDSKEFAEVVKAFDVIGMTKEEQDAIFRVTAAILHLQNMKFKPKGDGSECETPQSLNNAATLLRVDATSLEKCLTSMYVSAGKELILKGLNPGKSCDSRDAFSKALYDAVFNWIIRKINEKLDASKAHKIDNFIGLLDIYGFEAFEKNSFEQLCINYANEALQGVYNNYTFTKDIEECKNEGIDATSVVFNDNQECIDLIQKGIVNALTDSCRSSSTDIDFLERLKKDFLKKNKFFDASPLKREEFTVKHYAGDVSYTVTGWIEKNKDTLNNDLFQLTKASKCSFLVNLLENTGGAKDTVAESFRKQLNQLLTTINATRPHYIRCIKPHPAKKAGMFSNVEVMNQLRSSGVLETVKIRREGYSVRIPFDLFYHKFKIVLPANLQKLPPSEAKKGCEEIIKAVKFDKVKAQIGKTTVFMRHYAFTDLELLRGQKLTSFVLMMQAASRKLLALHDIKERMRLKKEEEDRIWREQHKEELERQRKEQEERDRIERERIEKIEAEKRRIEELRRQEEERLERERKEKEEMILRENRRLNALKQLQQKKMEELARIEREKEERERVRKELEDIESGKSFEQEEPTSVATWRVENGIIVGFTLTAARRDLVYRIKTDQLYTLEECKILIKEVVRIMKRDAENDFKNLLFLSKFRSEVLFPKPIITEYITESHGLNGFPDAQEINKLIYGKLAIKSDSEPNSILFAKEKLKLLVLNINKNIVKLIDNALRQRKERLLIIATIMDELETSIIKKYLHPNELIHVMMKIKQQSNTSTQ